VQFITSSFQPELVNAADCHWLTSHHGMSRITQVRFNENLAMLISPWFWFDSSWHFEDARLISSLTDFQCGQGSKEDSVNILREAQKQVTVGK